MTSPFDVLGRNPAAQPRNPAAGPRAARLTAMTARRVSEGRPARLAARLAASGAVAALAVAVVGWQPASLAIITGALTWLLRTGRADLGPRRTRR